MRVIWNIGDLRKVLEDFRDDGVSDSTELTICTSDGVAYEGCFAVVDTGVSVELYDDIDDAAQSVRRRKEQSREG